MPEVECVCGALVHEVSDNVWVDAKGDTRCYPDSEFDSDALHEPLEIDLKGAS